MLLIDDFTIIVAVVVLALALVSPFVNVLVARLRDDGDDGEDDVDMPGGNAPTGHKPGISVVVTVDDDGEDLKENLPLLLDQDYDGDYQVIVVVSGNDEMTENTLKLYADNPHLYTTFIPDSSRYMSRRKLAITIGVKAAKYEWVLLTDVDCHPDTRHWLTAMARNCSQSTDLVMGYSGFEDDYKACRRFDHVYTLYRQLVCAQKSRALGYFGSNLMFKKRMFIDGKGFDGNLKYIRGEYDFLVNKFSSDVNTAVELSPDARVTETELTDKGWRNKNIFYMSTRKHLKGATKHRVFFNATMWMMALAYVACIAAIVVAAMSQRWVLLGASAFSLILYIVLRCVVLGKSVRRYLDDMSYAKLWWFELTLPLRGLARIIRFKTTDKYDFICHKI